MIVFYALTTLVTAWWICQAHAQFPYITESDQSTNTQCLFDEDCFVFLSTLGNLTVDDIFCDWTTSHCAIYNGTSLAIPLPPKIKALCSAYFLPGLVTINTVVYDSVFPATSPYVDGIISISLTVSPPNSGIRGSLRIYPDGADPTPDGVCVGGAYCVLNEPDFIDQLFVNNPFVEYRFNRMEPGQYSIYYWDSAGCYNYKVGVVLYYVFDPLYNFYRSSGYSAFDFGCSTSLGTQALPTTPFNIVDDFLNFGNITNVTYPPTGPRKGIQLRHSTGVFGCRVTGPQICCPGQDVNNAGLPVDRLVTNRKMFAHLMDQSGGILKSFSVNDIAFGKVSFPPNLGMGNFLSAIETTYLAGVVSFQFGFGYASGAFSSTTTDSYLKDARGFFEGYTTKPIIHMLSITPELTNLPSPYILFLGSSWQRIINGYFVNTQSLTIPITANPSPFIQSFDSGTQPEISISGSRMASACNGNTAFETITVDYTSYEFPQIDQPGSPVTYVQLSQVNISAYPLTLTNITGPADIQFWPPPFITTVKFDFNIKTSGFYCLNVFVTTFASTPVLRTCFQIGQSIIAATQLFSGFMQKTGNIYALPFQGWGSRIHTNFFVSLPSTIIIEDNMLSITNPSISRMKITMTVASNITEFQDHLEQFSGTQYIILSEDPNDLAVPMSTFYTRVINAFDDSKQTWWLYTLSKGTYNQDLLGIKRNSAAYIEGQSVGVDILYNPDGLSTSDISYMCTTYTTIYPVESSRLQSVVRYEQPLCPADIPIATAYTVRGFGLNVNTPVLIAKGYSVPYNNPHVYEYTWINYDPNSAGFGTELESQLDASQLGAPPNTLIRLQTTALDGSFAYTLFRIESTNQYPAATVAFLPQVPVCDNGIQKTQIEFIIAGSFSNNSIAYWAPTDETARELYDPNSAFYDLPSNCSLFPTYSRYQVFLWCQKILIDSGNFTNTNASCTGCAFLPIPYPQETSDRVIRTALDQEKWQVIAWIETDVPNPDVPGRNLYCRLGNSTTSFLPQPPSVITLPLYRQVVDGVACEGSQCFVAEFVFAVSYYYPELLDGLTYTITPDVARNNSRPNYPLLEVNQRYVDPNTLYNISIFVFGGPTGSYFCPVVEQYLTVTRGPIVNLVRPSRVNCNTTSGTAVMYVSFQDPDFTGPIGTVQELCLFWPNSTKEGVAGPAVRFEVPINSIDPTLLPFAPFWSLDYTQFKDLRAGLQTFIIYQPFPLPDAYDETQTTCTHSVGFSGDELSLNIIDPFNLFVIIEFNISNFNNPAGGLQIVSTNRTDLAKCFGDKFTFSFRVTDDAGENGIGYPPYRIVFKGPRSSQTFYNTGDCSPINPFPTPTPLPPFSVVVFDGDIEVDTGGNTGLGFSGNYTLIVESCNSGCITTLSQYVLFPNPLQIFPTAVNTNCAYRTGLLLVDVQGGDPGTLQFYTPIGTDLIVPKKYNISVRPPGSNVFSFLQGSQLPISVGGLYDVSVITANGCQANNTINVTFAPPINVFIINQTTDCSFFTNGTTAYGINGGIGPYRIIQKAGALTNNTVITDDFLAQSTTIDNFCAVDSVNCYDPNCYTFTRTAPVQLNITVNKTDTCDGFLTGSVSASTTGVAISCQWVSDQTDVVIGNICNLVSIGAGTYHVFARTIDGCTSEGVAVVASLPPIIMTVVNRTATGFLNGPCIDNITISITGGAVGPPYGNIRFLDMFVGNVSSLTYDGNNTITIGSACRGQQYIVGATELSGSCLRSVISSDTLLVLGGGQGGELGLPPPRNVFKTCPEPCIPEEKKVAPIERSWNIFYILSGGVLALTILFFYQLVCRPTIIRRRSNSDAQYQPVYKRLQI